MEKFEIRHESLIKTMIEYNVKSNIVEDHEWSNNLYEIKNERKGQEKVLIIKKVYIGKILSHMIDD